MFCNVGQQQISLLQPNFMYNSVAFHYLANKTTSDFYECQSGCVCKLDEDQVKQEWKELDRFESIRFFCPAYAKVLDSFLVCINPRQGG